MRNLLAGMAAGLSLAGVPAPVQSSNRPPVDTALVVSVDVSNSVDQERYRLQMEGIASALEDPGVIEAITNGPNGGILFSMVTWADRPEFTLPWQKISNKQEALAVADKIRKLPQQGGEFTCMTRMMRSVNDKVVSQIPGEALRVVLDVSGDGPDNCNADEPIEKVRDELVANGVTVNGLPINIGDPSEPVGEGAYRAPGSNFSDSTLKAAGPITLEEWYRTYVMGGMGAFVLPANGYNDFGRAIRQKFVIEISGLGFPGQLTVGAAGNHEVTK
ncbi:MAG TPA: DUF1194 domain-containing protein [Hyphomicrobium sp.]|nr:DUF1194 domain-containing protein [Hyphomicrobium sp.]